MENENLRRTFKKFLTNQEKASQEMRKNDTALQFCADAWDLILPSNYEKVLEELWCSGDFGILLRSLKDFQKKRLYEEISNDMLGRILVEGDLANLAKILSEIPLSRKERFFNLGDTRYSRQVFGAVDFESQLQIATQILSRETIEKYLEKEYGQCEFLSFLHELCKKENYEEEKKEIFEKLAIMRTDIIARILEVAEPGLIFDIYTRMLPDDQKATWQQVKDEKLYHILESCDFKILDSPNNTKIFPIGRLSPQERQSVFSHFKKEQNIGELWRYFRIKDVIHYFYPIMNLEDKESNLYETSTTADIFVLYENLPEWEKIELLLIMVGEKTSGQYEDAKMEIMKENAIEVLEKVEKDRDLDYVEKLILKDLKENQKS